MSPEPVQHYTDFARAGASRVRRLHASQTESPSNAEQTDAGGHDGAGAAAPEGATTRLSPQRSANTKVILAGVGLFALIIGTIGYETFPRQPSGHLVGQEAGMTAATVSQTAPAPQAPKRSASSPVRPVQVAAAPKMVQPAPAESNAGAPKSPELAAMLALGPREHVHPQLAPGTASPATGSASPSAPSSNAPTPAGASDSNPNSPPAPAPIAAAQPNPASVAPAPVAPHPADAAQAAGKLVAAPMATQDQVDVLQLVTMEAALVQQDRSEVAALRAQMQRVQQESAEHVADMSRRLAMLEATKAVSDAAQAPQRARDDAAGEARRALAAAMGTPAPQLAPERAVTPAGAASSDASAPVATSPNWVPHYRIVSASPLLAMVQDDNAPSGQTAQLEVQVGTSLRGYGIVQSIYQAGTSWVIKTDHGQIS